MAPDKTVMMENASMVCRTACSALPPKVKICEETADASKVITAIVGVSGPAQIGGIDVASPTTTAVTTMLIRSDHKPIAIPSFKSPWKISAAKPTRARY